MVEEQQGFKGIDFIDLLFAIVVGEGFSEVMQAPWFTDPSKALDSPFYFHIGVLILGYLTVLLSWVFYHLSLKNAPATGFWRFLCDIAMLGAYFLLLVKSENLALVLLLLAITFVLYYLWDQLKRREYLSRDKTPARRGVTVFWLPWFVGLATLVWFFGETGDISNPGWIDGLFLGLAVLFVLAYRLHKMYLWLPGLLECLASWNLPISIKSMED